MADTEVPLFARRLVITPPHDTVPDVRRDIQVPGADGVSMMLVDVYRPPGVAVVPAVVIVVGYPGGTMPGAFKNLAFVRDWATWFAAAGVAAVTYTNRTPSEDLTALLTHIAHEGASWGIDAARVGLFAQSGHGPVAIGALLKERGFGLRCAAFTYGFMLDVEGRTAVAEAATRFGFSNPCDGATLDDVDSSVSILVVRAGQDQFDGLNGSIDDFVSGALARNRPISVVNLPAAPHAFDLADSSAASQMAIRQVIAFVREQLTV
jgi:dienelactone hydrolase